jgi:glycosyltransferase involved in cell wall biosynthesis
MNPYFSIIIPTCNRSEMLRKAVGSILDQACGDWELIIVDDGSTDDTREWQGNG